MDTTENLTYSAKSVMAPPTTAPSVIVSLHPLVIMNISEHWTRVRAQLGKATKGKLSKLTLKTSVQNVSNFCLI